MLTAIYFAIVYKYICMYVYTNTEGKRDSGASIIFNFKLILQITVSSKLLLY